MWLIDLITEYIGLGWLILGVLGGLFTIGVFYGLLDNYSILLGIIVLIGIWVIGGIRKYRNG